MYFLQILLTSFVTGTQVLLLAAGLYLIYAVARFFHIFLAEMMVGGAYGFYFTTQILHFPLWLGFISGIIFAMGLGTISFLILKPLIKKQQALLALLLSLTLGIAFQAIFSITFGVDGKFLLDQVLPTYDLAGLRVTQVGFWTILFGLSIAAIAYIFIYLLPHGRMIRAVAQHPECANLIGIKEQKVQLGVFLVTGLICGVIGIFAGINTAIIPQAGLHPLIMAFAAVLIGGVADFRGTIIASYLISLIPELIVSGAVGGASLNTSWKMVFVFLLALILLIIKPNGLFSKLTRKS